VLLTLEKARRKPKTVRVRSKIMANTVEILGSKFLKCQQQDCEWNIGWLGRYEWIREPDKGTRICNFGLKTIIDADAVPPDICQQPAAVLKIARARFKL
jgi:hypothetical protein